MGGEGGCENPKGLTGSVSPTRGDSGSIGPVLLVSRSGAFHSPRGEEGGRLHCTCFFGRTGLGDRALASIGRADRDGGTEVPGVTALTGLNGEPLTAEDGEAP